MSSDVSHPYRDAAAYTLAASPFAFLSLLAMAVVAVELVGDVAVGLALVAGLVVLTAAFVVLLRAARPSTGALLPRLRRDQT